MKQSRLETGAVLITENLPQFASLSIGVWVGAGSRHESPKEGGLSHFLEHMLFKGTKARSALEIAQEVDRAGGEFNAFTAREHTCFHFLLLSKDVKLAVEILSDVLLNSTMSPDELEKERKVILQEIAMVADNPEEYLHDVFFENAWGEHSLGRPILGTHKSVSNFSRDQVFRYFQKHYDPARMVISVAGDLDHNDLVKKLNHALRSHSSKSTHKLHKQKRVRSKSPRVCAATVGISKELEQSHLLLGFPGVSQSDSKRYALSLMNIHLGGGMSSRLFQEIREKRGMAYSVYSSHMPFSDVGLFTIYLATAPHELQECVRVIGDELNRLKEEPLSDRLLEMHKENLKNTIILNGDSVESRMSYLARCVLAGEKYLSADQLCRRIDDVSAKEIQSLAKQVFCTESMALGLMGNQAGRQVKGLRRLLSQCTQSQPVRPSGVQRPRR